MTSRPNVMHKNLSLSLHRCVGGSRGVAIICNLNDPEAPTDSHFRMTFLCKKHFHLQASTHRSFSEVGPTATAWPGSRFARGRILRRQVELMVVLEIAPGSAPEFDLNFSSPKPKFDCCSSSMTSSTARSNVNTFSAWNLYLHPKCH